MRRHTHNNHRHNHNIIFHHRNYNKYRIFTRISITNNTCNCSIGCYLFSNHNGKEKIT